MNAPRRRKHQTPRSGVLLAFRAFSAEAFQRQSNQYTRVPSLFFQTDAEKRLKAFQEFLIPRTVQFTIPHCQPNN